VFFFFFDVENTFFYKTHNISWIPCFEIFQKLKLRIIGLPSTLNDLYDMHHTRSTGPHRPTYHISNTLPIQACTCTCWTTYGWLHVLHLKYNTKSNTCLRRTQVIRVSGSLGKTLQVKLYIYLQVKEEQYECCRIIVIVLIAMHSEEDKPNL